MRTLKILVLALGLASFATACGKKKDPAAPAAEPAANPCGGGEANPCGGGEGGEAPADPCGGAADPCGGGE